MNKQEKAREIDTMRGVLMEVPPTFVMSYTGLTVNDVAALRKKVRATSSTYRVVKNRLMLRALKETPLEPLSPEFRGPTVIAYSSEEPSALAKVLDEFAKTNKGLKFKAGFVDGRVIGGEQFSELANLPSREVLLARLLGALQGPMTNLVKVLKAPVRDLVLVLDQIARKGKDAPADDGSGSTGAPAADAGKTEAPPQP